MGFPIGCYTEVRIPKLLLHLVILLGYVRRLISWAFDKAGLGDLLDSDEVGPWPSEQQPQPQPQPQPQQPQSGFQSVSALRLRIEEILPVVLYKDLSEREEKCAVCLYEVEAPDEVRRLRNCSHVFHKGCLDSWMRHDQYRTCPLCRTPLIPGEMQLEALDERFWGAAGLLDSSD